MKTIEPNAATEKKFSGTLADTAELNSELFVMFERKLPVYDKIYRRQVIAITVGLCHRIRLAIDKHVLMYSDGEDHIYLVYCKRCNRYYLDRKHGVQIRWFRCPFHQP